MSSGNTLALSGPQLFLLLYCLSAQSAEWLRSYEARKGIDIAAGAKLYASDIDTLEVGRELEALGLVAVLPNEGPDAGESPWNVVLTAHGLIILLGMLTHTYFKRALVTFTDPIPAGRPLPVPSVFSALSLAAVEGRVALAPVEDPVEIPPQLKERFEKLQSEGGVPTDHSD